VYFLRLFAMSISFRLINILTQIKEMSNSKRSITPILSTQRPEFQNGDMVRYRSIKNSYGVMMHCDYKYIPRLKSYYCIVDFYPSSTISLGLSKYDNYERRYVYEYELIKIADVPPRWALYDGLIK